MADPIAKFSQMPGCVWRAKGRAAVSIPANRVTETVEKRVVARRRAYKRGAKLDTTSRDYLVWEIEAIFHEGSDEDGIPFENNYPQEANKLCDSINVDETGDLTLPTRGKVRAQFKGYRRVEDTGMTDACALVLTFWEDSEDSTNLASFSAPAGKAVSKRIAERATETCAQAGAWSTDISELNEFAAGLEALANSPFESVENFNTQVLAVAHKIEQVERTFADAGNRGAGELATILTKPESSLAGRTLRTLSDTTRRMTLATAGMGEVTTRTFARDMSIFDIAAQLDQDPVKLMHLNAGIPDIMAIPARTPVKVLKTF